MCTIWKDPDWIQKNKTIDCFLLNFYPFTSSNRIHYLKPIFFKSNTLKAANKFPLSKSESKIKASEEFILF